MITMNMDFSEMPDAVWLKGLLPNAIVATVATIERSKQNYALMAQVLPFCRARWAM